MSSPTHPQTRTEVIEYFVKLVQVIIMLTYPIFTGITSYVVVSVIKHDTLIAVINSKVSHIVDSRYTSEDAATDRQALSNKIDTLSVNQATTDAYMEQLILRLDRIDSKLDRYTNSIGVEGAD